jgi:hypothetical protein
MLFIAAADLPAPSLRKKMEDYPTVKLVEKEAVKRGPLLPKAFRTFLWVMILSTSKSHFTTKGIFACG